LLACWFIRGLLVCATMMWSWERPAKRREWKLIVSGLLVYESMACLTSTDFENEVVQAGRRTEDDQQSYICCGRVTPAGETNNPGSDAGDSRKDD
jgi:hypothetical protein